MSIDEVLGKCSQVVDERSKNYGDPRTCFNEIARRWSQHLKIDIDASQVAICMTELKMVRQSFGTQPDNIIDAINFLAFCQLFQSYELELAV